MASKRSPQTAAKRAREQAMREKRERKLLKKQAAIAAKNAPEPVEGEDELLEDGEEAEASDAAPELPE
jgi:hypothetical protein